MTNNPEYRLARWVVPFCYFVRTRLASRREIVSWSLTYIVPLCLLAATVANFPSLIAVLWTLLLITLVYCAYEYGYLVNDAVTTQGESNPTLRIGEGERVALCQVLPTVFALRLALLVGCAAVFGALTNQRGLSGLYGFGLAAFLGGLILVTYFAYNRVRSRLSIVLFFLLVTLRFCGPIAVIASLEEFDLLILVGLVFLYPIPNMIEFSGKSRFRLPFLRWAVEYVDSWRVVYYAALWFLLVYFPPSSSSASQVMTFGATYFLAYRTLTLFARILFGRQIRAMHKSGSAWPAK